MAALFLNAGKAAKASTAYQAAYDYLHSGVSLLDSENYWETDYELLFELHLHLSECSHLTDRKDQAERILAFSCSERKTNLKSLKFIQ